MDLRSNSVKTEEAACEALFAPSGYAGRDRRRPRAEARASQGDEHHVLTGHLVVDRSTLSEAAGIRRAL